MNKDIKLILVALVVLALGALSFNYLDTTGKTINEDITSISVNPKTVEAGDVLYITINPGRQGVYKDMEVYRENDIRYGTQIPEVCRSSKCFERNTAEFKIIESWDNNNNWDSSERSKNYYVQVYDIYSGKWIRSYFSVERAL